MKNLFWSTRNHMTEEDHLTEFFATALNISSSFRDSFSNLVLANFAKLKSWSDAKIENVDTQVEFEGTTCRPDMILSLSNGKRIACEHKLYSPETIGPEIDNNKQLERYLNLPIDGLVYIRASWVPPDKKVEEHPKYIKPVEREHFLWQDFYPYLGPGQHVVLDWLKEGFEWLGFTPPNPSVGEMSGPDEEMNRKNCINFAKLWNRTCSYAHKLGWKVGTGSIVEIYLSENPSSLASWVFISPIMPERFLFRVTPQEGTFSQLENALRTAVSCNKVLTEVTVNKLKRVRGEESVIDVTTSLFEILGASPLSAEEIEKRLLDFTKPLFLALQQ